jgi:hypothetical protein
VLRAEIFSTDRNDEKMTTCVGWDPFGGNQDIPTVLLYLIEAVDGSECRTLVRQSGAGAGVKSHRYYASFTGFRHGASNCG